MTMKEIIRDLLLKSIQSLTLNGQLLKEFDYQIHIERSRSPEHGDFACSIALSLAKIVRMKPRDLAQLIVEHLPAHDEIQTVSIAGPGFINFHLSQNAYCHVIETILKQRNDYGIEHQAKPKKINIEYVSSNPTGPLHVGHGRSAAYGSALANLLEVEGHQVHREYYVNDAGRQMDILTVSVWLRYLELLKVDFNFPKNAYKGHYVIDIAQQLLAEFQNKFLHSPEEIFAEVPPDESENLQGDKEAHIDGIIINAKKLLGLENYQFIFQRTLKTILADIQNDLSEFRVEFQEWFSEAHLVHSKAVAHAIEKLQSAGHTYESEGALWFRATSFGDDKDRVLVRENGQTTYFASDVAYLLNKYERGFDELIFIFGADHHGYITRLTAAAEALGISPKHIKILIVQFAVLYRGTERVQMSTRSGSFITLRELRHEVGNDAARFFYVMRKCDQHLDFDLELAKSDSRHNPVYYVQYAHARISSIFRQLQEKNAHYDTEQGLKNLHLLNLEREKRLMSLLGLYVDMLRCAAKHHEPHQIINFLIELSQELHAYYNDTIILVEQLDLRQARLCLIDAIKQVMVNALRILAISAPDKL